MPPEPQPTLTVTAESRPIRSAFLIDPRSTTGGELNSIVRYCCGIWGGRFHGIIPTDGLAISENWWQVLRLCDPDRICSFVELSPELLHRINRYIAPSEIHTLTPTEKERLSPGYKICRWYPEALGVDGIPFRVWQSRQLHLEPTLLYIVDSHQEGGDYDFVLRNFGVLSPIISMKEAFRDVPHTPIDLNPLNIEELLKTLAEQTGRPIVPLRLCADVRRFTRSKSAAFCGASAASWAD